MFYAQVRFYALLKPIQSCTKAKRGNMFQPSSLYQHYNQTKQSTDPAEINFFLFGHG